MSQSIIQVKNLSASYFGEQVLQNISFSFETGKLIGIIGPNGAGKSTMMKAMLGLIPKDTGEVQIDGESIHKFRQQVAYIPQRSTIDWDFPITVFDTVLLGTYPSLGLFRRPGKAEKDWARQCLQEVAMEQYSHHQIGELSGGQQQRVFIARALAQKAQYFFLDEPFVGIDVSSEKTIINILKNLRDAGKTIFVIHHDLSKAEEYFNDLILINKKLIKSGPVQEVIDPDVMSSAYQTDFTLFPKMGVEM